MTREDWLKLREDLQTDAEKAFECLYNQLWEKLYSVSFNYVREKAAAQDIGAFAMRAVKNRIYDHFDKKAIQDLYLLRAAQTMSKPVNTTQQQVEYNETFKLIDTEIDKLPETTKKIFRLSRFDRFTNEEIASTLKLSVKSVEYHITQALKQLRLTMGYIGTVVALLLGIF